MVYRLILPEWRRAECPSLPRSRDGEFSDEQLKEFNEQGYNIYFFPNAPGIYNRGATVDGSQIDVFRFVFVDFDLKHGACPSKEAFVAALEAGPPPTFVVDTGNGVHAYWGVSDLDAMSFLRLGRRLMRKYNTDEAVQKICQVMRVPGTMNTKVKGEYKSCKYIFEGDASYTCEQLDSLLPTISAEDESYCQTHWNKTYQVREDVKVEDIVPVKFHKLLRANKEVQKIWSGDVPDRSIADYRLGHIMLASGFTKEESMSVLVNSGKALQRAPIHRVGYAEGIVDKVWAYEEEPTKPGGLDLSMTVQEVLDGAKTSTAGRRIPCWSWVDNTVTGFQLGHVIGLVAGPKVGKTVLSLNMFYGFVTNNPDMDHVFVALEQPAREIAKKWEKLCAGRAHLYKRVHVISNYDADGTHRQLSLTDIKDYLIKFQKTTKRKIGCVVIDHIGALKQDSADGFRAIEQICHDMKSVAIATDTLLVMQSHAPRAKAGRGDLELNQDAAYGTQRFEAYVDWLITMWQPLKRSYSNKKCPKVTAFKFAAVRHKEEGDAIEEDVLYRMTFVSATGALREMTEAEETSFDYFNKACANKRKQDKKQTEILTYTSAKTHEATNPSNQDTPAA